MGIDYFRPSWFWWGWQIDSMNVCIISIALRLTRWKRSFFFNFQPQYWTHTHHCLYYLYFPGTLCYLMSITKICRSLQCHNSPFCWKKVTWIKEQNSLCGEARRFRVWSYGRKVWEEFACFPCLKHDAWIIVDAELSLRYLTTRMPPLLVEVWKKLQTHCSFWDSEKPQ